MSGTFYDDPNRESLGLPPIWTGAGEPPPEIPGDDPDPASSPGTHTIAAIRQWVDDNPDRADEVLAAEEDRGGDARVSLLEWLEGFIAHRDDDE